MNEPQRVFASAYSESRLWDKLVAYARAAGKKVIYEVLQLYYAAQSPGTPVWAKSTIYGALGYFISVLDAIPDFTPVAGYSDDLGVLALAIAVVSAHVTPEVKARAAAKMREWFDG
jgi:uncharacterized membrane protein YkvA (DUF1232 family)